MRSRTRLKNIREDYYSLKAKEEGYPARSVYKLKEMDEKYQLIKAGDKVLDLGCAPGSWLLYISKKIGDKGMVTGIDIESINIPFSRNIQFFKADVFKLDDLEFLLDRYDLVVSDLAPATSGVKFADAQKSLELCQRVFQLAQKFLRPGGNFVCKIFEGESSADFLKEIKNSFKMAKKFKPKAVRRGSREFYIVAKGYGGNKN